MERYTFTIEEDKANNAVYITDENNNTHTFLYYTKAEAIKVFFEKVLDKTPTL